MKILFLHLSDAHFREDTNVNDLNINAMVNALSQLEKFDECILVFSGDLVQAGKENQYKVAGKFIGRLINGIRNKYMPEKTIQTLIVPGNHDNLAANPNRDVDELKSYYSSKKETEDKFYGELTQLSNFYTFAQRNYCYTKGKVVDVRKLTFGKFTIKVNLINTAPFSLLCKGNEDKGLHYLPQREIDKLDFDRQENYTVSIIHHGPEWFSDEPKNALYTKLYEVSDLIFVGHEHFSLSENKTVNGKHQIDVSSGVALYGTNKEQGFNALILDTEKCSLHGEKYIYNGKIYKPTPNMQNDHVVFRGKHHFTHTQEYKKFLETDTGQRNGESYLDYFVFPALEAKNINSEIDTISISTEEKFMEIFKLNPKIFIEGGLNSGKTTLAKYLCLKLSEDYVPLLLTEEDFRPKNNKNVIKYALEDQYGDDADCDELLQLEKDKLVLIVDRSDRLDTKRWESFYEEYQEKFGHIVLLCGNGWNINIKEKALEELTENKFLDLKISPFYYAKREELIRKICESSDTRAMETNETVRKINDEITGQVKYFQLNPDFIHQYVNYYLNFSFIKTQNDNNVFSKVFEANITFRIAQNTEEENVNEILVALDFVAHYAHFNKCAYLTVEEFENAVNSYNEAYDNELKPKMVYDVALKANIIKENHSHFGVEFCDENLLAYFTALHLNRSFNEGKCAKELEYLLNNICFGINGDILLFLSYITSNVQILTPIMNSMVSLMEEWEELSLEEKNVQFLTQQVAPHVKQETPNQEDKKKNAQKKTELEKSVVEEKHKNLESLYSYDETQVNSFSNKISRSLCYLELVAKILPNFRHILGGPDKKAVVSILYKYPNKLLYFMLKDIDNNLQKIIDEVLSKNPKTKRGILITQDMLVRSLQAQAMGYILSVYDFVACTASVGKGIDELNRLFPFEESTNYLLQNVMMEENNGKFSDFSKKAMMLYDKTEMNIVKNMVAMVVRKYFLNHDVTLIGNAQSLADKFFVKSDRKNLQLIQAKNHIVKK